MSVHNKGHYIKDIIKSLRITEPKAELILVDDGSTDNTGDILKKYADVFVRTENVWEVKANNAGLRMASGDFIGIIQDDDLILAKGWLTSHARLMKEKGIGIIGGRGLGHFYFKKRKSSKPLPKSIMVYRWGVQLGRVIDFFCIEDYKIYRLDLYLNNFFGNSVFEADATIRGPFIISRNVIEKIGFFDESYAPLGYDDHAYCMAAKKIGFKIGITIIPHIARYKGGSHWLYSNSDKKGIFIESFAKNIMQLAHTFLEGFREYKPLFLRKL